MNGVNVIGLSMQQSVQPVPAPSLKPPLLHQPSADFSTQQLQPRRPTTGNVDFLLPLQPELLLGKFFSQYKIKIINLHFFSLLPDRIDNNVES